MDLLQRFNSKVPFTSGEINLQVPLTVVVDREKLKWKTDF
jgi:hypothetical protein